MIDFALAERIYEVVKNFRIFRTRKSKKIIDADDVILSECPEDTPQVSNSAVIRYHANIENALVAVALLRLAAFVVQTTRSELFAHEENRGFFDNDNLTVGFVVPSHAGQFRFGAKSIVNLMESFRDKLLIGLDSKEDKHYLSSFDLTKPVPIGDQHDTVVYFEHERKVYNGKLKRTREKEIAEIRPFFFGRETILLNMHSVYIRRPLGSMPLVADLYGEDNMDTLLDGFPNLRNDPLFSKTNHLSRFTVQMENIVWQYIESLYGAMNREGAKIVREFAYMQELRVCYAHHYYRDVIKKIGTAIAGCAPSNHTQTISDDIFIVLRIYYYYTYGSIDIAINILSHDIILQMCKYRENGVVVDINTRDIDSETRRFVNAICH